MAEVAAPTAADFQGAAVDRAQQLPAPAGKPPGAARRACHRLGRAEPVSAAEGLLPNDGNSPGRLVFVMANGLHIGELHAAKLAIELAGDRAERKAGHRDPAEG